MRIKKNKGYRGLTFANVFLGMTLEALCDVTGMRSGVTTFAELRGADRAAGTVRPRHLVAATVRIRLVRVNLTKGITDAGGVDGRHVLTPGGRDPH